MKKLHSFVFYALVSPAITLGAGSALAQSTAQGTQSATQSNLDTTPTDKNAQGAAQSDLNKDTDNRNAAGTQSNMNMGNQTRMENRGYMDSAPANGVQASDLIGADVRTNDDQDIGSVKELIIDEGGQVVAIVVSVGGFLGMGERDVAIGWDDVTRSGIADDYDLRVDVSSEALKTAPEFKVVAKL
ncbi:PRC-barrel domain-containing protein [Nitrincola sp. MINF-07-Sa-05]|uniref:PRC-barrel domain-containing protein n=1 Tax=Nitrincola salilacus TaxID=3400273 RepID=UPI0039181A91